MFKRRIKSIGWNEKEERTVILTKSVTFVFSLSKSKLTFFFLLLLDSGKIFGYNNSWNKNSKNLTKKTIEKKEIWENNDVFFCCAFFFPPFYLKKKYHSLTFVKTAVLVLIWFFFIRCFFLLQDSFNCVCFY